MDDRHIKQVEINNYFNEFSGIIRLNNYQGNYDINKISENRAIGLFNLIYGYDLENANKVISDNFPAIDLVDKKSRVCVQVTSTSEKDKIVYTLEKFIEKRLYEDFDKLIIYILTDKPRNYQAKTHKQVKDIAKKYINFDLKNDVIDNKDLAKEVGAFVNIRMISAVHEYLTNEFNKTKIFKDVYPKELNAFAKFRLDTLIGRGDIIDEIHKKFNSSDIVLLRGVGGIGKTAIAKSYLEIYKNYYDHLAYIDVNDSIISSIIKKLSSIEPSFEYNSEVSKMENLSVLINKLYLIKNTLLVIDNCNNADELRQLKGSLELLNWNILITSRALPPVYNDEVVNVDHINPEDAYNLFVKNFGRYVSNYDTIIIRRILLKIRYHTKLVIILSKAAHNNPLLKLEELADRVYAEIYNEDKINVIVSLDLEEHKVYDFLLLLFEPNLLTQEQKRYLKYFTILPPNEISIEHLIHLYERNEKHGSFVDTINKLTEKGWLESYENYYRIHPVIQLVTKKKLVINMSNSSTLIDNSIHYLRLSDNYTVNLVYLTYGESIAKFFEYEVSEKLGILYNYLSLLNRDVYRLKDALVYSLHAVEILKLYPKQAEMLAQVYGNISGIYSSLNNFNDALSSIKDALAIQNSILPSNHHDIGATYNNFANIHFSAARNSNVINDQMYHYNSAIGYLKHSLEILENLSKKNPRVNAIAMSDCHTGLANVYEDMYYVTRDRHYLNLHLESDEKALDVVVKYLGDNHPKTAIVYNNNGLSYMKNNNLELGFDFIERALNIRRKILVKNHPDIGVSLYNLARAYLALKQKPAAIVALEESIEILQSINDYRHPTLESVLGLYKSIT